MREPIFCNLAGCMCVVFAQVADACASCELLHPDYLPDDLELIDEPEIRQHAQEVLSRE